VHYDIYVELVALCISELKLGKTSGLYGAEAEHLLYAHQLLCTHLCKLFSFILRHGYVPNCFGKGIIISLVGLKNNICRLY